MATVNRYESYPVGTVLLSNLVSLSIYGLGVLIIFRLGLVFSALYLLYIFILELRLIKDHCTNCFYWGKTCGFGKGKISSLFFKKGDTSRFCIKEMTWKDMIPDILVSLIPLMIGIILLIIKFDFILLSALLLLIVLNTAGNSFIRGKLTCKHCKQEESGCPASNLFNRER